MNYRLPYNTEKRCILKNADPGAKRYRAYPCFPDPEEAGGEPAPFSCTFQQILSLENEILSDCLSRLVFTRAVNQCRARKVHGSDLSAAIQFLLPGKTAEKWLKASISRVSRAAAQLSETSRKNGDGKIVLTQVSASSAEQISEPLFTVTMTGMSRGAAEPAAAAGKSIVASGYAGEAGSAVLARVMNKELSRRYSAGFLAGAVSADPGHFLIAAPQTVFPQGAESSGDFCCPAGEGGIFAALWYLAEEWNCGFRVTLPDIPIRQETVEICDTFDLNPYQMASDGMALTITSEPEKAIENLRGLGAEAEIIGTLQDSRDKIIENRGENRCLDRPAPDSLLTGLEFLLRA